MSVQIFCPYLGRDIDESAASREHVVPESLGGRNALSIFVERSANTELGTSVDGPVADQVFAYHRTKYKLTGHSRRLPSCTFDISIDELEKHEAKWEVSETDSLVRLKPRVARTSVITQKRP